MAFKHYKYFIDREPLMQFACFECRKSFKRKLGRETYICPQCEKEMCEMGRQFKAPKLDDVKQWRKVEALVRGGITFHSQRLYSLRNMPKVLRGECVVRLARRNCDTSEVCRHGLGEHRGVF